MPAEATPEATPEPTPAPTPARGRDERGTPVIGPDDPLYPGDEDPLIEQLEEDDSEPSGDPPADFRDQSKWPRDPQAPESDPAIGTSYPD